MKAQSEAGWHGVQHSGNTHNMTEKQRGLITQLVEKDLILYDYVNELFNRQVRIIEQGTILLCVKL